MTHILRRSTLVIASVLVAGGIAAGCSAGSEDRNITSADGGAPAAKAAAPEQAAGSTAEDVPAKAPDLSVDQRAIIYTGSITIKVTDVKAAAAKAIGMATAAGGYVGGDQRAINGDASSATLQLRVPAAKFQTVVDELATGLGTEEQRGINAQDVTEQTVDLAARITVQQARVDSGRKLLAQAKTLNDLVMLEKEVATRQADLASLQSKQRHLADLTALSTITVTLMQPKAVPPAAKPAKAGFFTGLRHGWHALMVSFGVVLTVLGAILPWIIALGAPAALLIYLFRRYARRRPAPSST